MKKLIHDFETIDQNSLEDLFIVLAKQLKILFYKQEQCQEKTTRFLTAIKLHNPLRLKYSNVKTETLLFNGG